MNIDIKNIFEDIKSRLEAKLPFVKSEIIEVTQPSIRGDNALSYYINTEQNGVSAYFYDNGFFEIATDLIVDDAGDYLYVTHVPPNHQSEKYSKYDIDLFVEKMNELIALLDKGRGDL